MGPFSFLGVRHAPGAVASLRPSLCVGYSFSGLGSRCSMTSSGASASRCRPRSLGPVVLGLGPWAVVRAAVLAVFTRGPWRVGLRARPVGRVALTRYSLELADPGLEFDQVLARARRSVGRGAWFAAPDPVVVYVISRAVYVIFFPLPGVQKTATCLGTVANARF